MDKNKQQFLRILYFQLFELYEREKQLMGNIDFPDDNGCIRNDQSISEARKTSGIIEKLIDIYLQ